MVLEVLKAKIKVQGDSVSETVHSLGRRQDFLTVFSHVGMCEKALFLSLS